MFAQILLEFENNRDQVLARPMAKYMRNQFPYLGLSRPKRNELQAEFIKAIKREKEINWEFVFQCWARPEREYQYLALDYLAKMEQCLKKQDIFNIAILIADKPWWDTVDLIAVQLLGKLCARYPELIEAEVAKWAAGDNIWLIRSALLFQLKYKDNTDKELLTRLILQNNNTQEFFINKAIGWALREYSKSNPEWVKEFISNNQLHSLSVREGSKHLLRKLEPSA